MQELLATLDSIAERASIEVGGGELSSGSFRELLARRAQTRQAADEVRQARVAVPDDLLARLGDGVRAVLGEYVEPSTDQIGHVFPVASGALVPGRAPQGTTTHLSDGVVSLEVVSHVETFAAALAAGAAILGAERVAGLVAGWLRGEPVRYQIRSILNSDGILQAPVSPMEGVRLESLPLSTDRLSGNLPLTGDRSPGQYLGRTLLTIDHSASPALFRPGGERTVRAERATAAPDAGPDVICQALALEADAFTEVAFSWLDFGDDLGVFSLRREEVWSSGRAHFRLASFRNYSVQTDHHRDATTLTVKDPPEIEVDGERLGAVLTALAGSSSGSLQIAASRWLQSKDTSPPLEDRFIDLRTAMESLYLRDFQNEHSQEMGFRVALFGAWHLGADLEERRTLRKTLRDAYGAASRAVHYGDVDSGRGARRKREDPAGRWREHEKLLSETQGILRRGLLAVIANGPPPDWGDLVLGGGPP
ncbi:MAG: hypothetical protein F4X76_06440 [Chloroflexi bacterium]|nr:hypothetical protein [Chloroflexota bacterium]